MDGFEWQRGPTLRVPPLEQRPAYRSNCSTSYLCRARCAKWLIRPGCLSVVWILAMGAAVQHWLESVVSKRRDAPYRSGECHDWVKVKTKSWRATSRSDGGSVRHNKSWCCAGD